MAIAVFTSFEQLTNATGVILDGGSVTVYQANSTTLISLFSDTALSSGVSNPITLGSDGRHAMTYFSVQAYKVLVKDADGNTVFTRDNIDPGVPVGTGALAIANGGTGATSAAAALAALGGATAAEVADVAADVAAISGSLASTEKTHIATGTTAQRPGSPVEGDIRRNTTTSRYEGYYAAAWQQFYSDAEIASQAEAVAMSDNTKVMTPLRAKQGNPFCSALYHIQETRSSGVASSNAPTSGAWRTVVINTETTAEITGASLSSNVISLPAGTYEARASMGLALANVPGQLRLQNTTDATTLCLGRLSSTAATSLTTFTPISLEQRFTISGTKNVELQVRVGANANALAGASWGTEVYVDLRIWKVG